MITLYFFRSWLKVLGFLAAVALAEYAFAGHLGVWFVLALSLTVATFVGITVLMYRDWKVAHRNGSYRYDIVRDVTHTR